MNFAVTMIPCSDDVCHITDESLVPFTGIEEDYLGNSASMNLPALVQAELFEKAGDIYRSLGQPDKAMQYYRKAGAYQRAVDLARVSFPSDVVRLEAEWADYLVKNHQLDSAIHHYIEAG
ncbi:unnamed protein product [Protopolystoma xenopodis]|uniref:Uncharacterized protein n=1 Tax=Protopolystoma xenopodis TaxID=117903 RepID=A0A3S4ZXG3_9PLAT|nr:unnamed protein product [Protopolystoma xenopodis]